MKKIPPGSVSELPGGCPKISLPRSLCLGGRFYLAYDKNIAMVLADFVVHETINLLWPRSKLIGKIIEDSKCFDSTNRIICFAFIFNFNSSIIHPFTARILDGALLGDCLSLWTESYDVTIQMKALCLYLHIVLFGFQNFTERNLKIWSKFAFG